MGPPKARHRRQASGEFAARVKMRELSTDTGCASTHPVPSLNITGRSVHCCLRGRARPYALPKSRYGIKFAQGSPPRLYPTCLVQQCSPLRPRSAHYTARSRRGEFE